ncbi:MAG: hypothetical protein Q4G48_04720 [Bacteroidia bacterium]|nr:hypothetical protein [Bacteroidia bacterium]
MKKILSLFLLASFLFSCEKIDSSLTGNWQLSESKYVITANEDFTFVDVFGAPWQGAIKIDDEEFDASLFRYYFNNVRGQIQLASPDLILTFAGPKLEVHRNGATYMLNNGYTLDIAEGMFNADGTATYEGKSIRVHIDLVMPRVELKKGEQFSVHDAYRHIPYEKLSFNNGGKLQTDFLTGDILETKPGKWNSNGSQLIISVKNRATDIYRYDMNVNSLLLSKDKTTKEGTPPHISPFATKISKITYQALYMRE